MESGGFHGSMPCAIAPSSTNINMVNKMLPAAEMLRFPRKAVNLIQGEEKLSAGL